jgi:hypothetical protein
MSLIAYLSTMALQAYGKPNTLGEKPSSPMENNIILTH